VSGPVVVEGATRFAVGVQEGFDYITEISNWHEYWPRFVSLDPASRWSEPGDRARLSLRLLGREVELELALVRFEPYALVEYTSVQDGIPPARHRREFSDGGDHLAYRLSVSYEPRSGWRGGLDRTVIRRAIARSVGETVTNLERRLGRDHGVGAPAQEAVGQ
jgi:hypothetical protein